MDIFEIMKRDKEYTGIGGYLNSEFRSARTDNSLLAAAAELELSYAHLFLWVNSRYARHGMDKLSNGQSIDMYFFTSELREMLPQLLEEVGAK